MKAIKIRVSCIKQFFRGRRGKGTHHLPYTERRPSTFFNNYPANRRHLIRTWQTLHHYSCHSPIPVAKKWRAANARFDRQHFGSRRGSMRFINTYTLHAWM